MSENWWLHIWLILISMTAGVVNSVAWGGTFLTFPALLTAVAPVVANGTSTIALVPGSLSAAWGYRREVRGLSNWFLLLLILPCLAGGFVGAILVTRLDPRYFSALVPWLILIASLLFLFQPVLRWQAFTSKPGPLRMHTAAAIVLSQFLVSIYGGYFGAGTGILTLGVLSLTGLNDIHALNGIKNILAVCINGISVVVFIVHGVIDWRLAILMAPAAAIGAYGSALFCRKLDPRLVRWIIILLGFTLVIHFTVKHQ